MMLSRLITRKQIYFCLGRGLCASKTTDFGFANVNAQDKEGMVKEVFTRVAEKYDLMNDVMSVGIHRLWKDEFVKNIGISAASKARPLELPRHLDVAGGTGDIAFRVLEEYVKSYPVAVDKLLSSVDSLPYKDEDRNIVVCDINPDMLSVGKQRAQKKLGTSKSQMMGFVEGNAEKLIFPDGSFNTYTIAFGLRNVTNKDAAIQEAFRVLRPGGRFMILEFSHLENNIMQQIYDQYSFNVIPKMGELVANDAASYQYLVESIRKFPKQDQLVQMMQSAGFTYVTYENLTFGVVAIHSGFKI